MEPDDESPNPTERDDVIPNVQPAPTHSWLQNDDAPATWAPPPPASSPPPPPSRSAAPTPPPTPALAPAPAPPPPVPVRAPTLDLAPARPTSGYDAPAPDSRWHTYLQRGPLPAQATARPRATVAGGLLLAGAALAVLGSVLTWATFPDELVTTGVPRTFNGFTELPGESRDGPFFAAFAGIIAAFGITLLLAKRIKALLILSAILAGFGAVAAVIDLLDVADPDGLAAELQPGVGVGIPVVAGGFVIAFAGSVIGLLTGRSAK